MKEEQIATALNGVLETLSALEHERWCHWQRYLHSKCSRQHNGTLIIPAEFVEKWEKQIQTPYVDLSEKEKESDREQVRKYLPLVAKFLAASRVVSNQ